jgi:hypothetical protein
MYRVPTRRYKRLHSTVYTTVVYGTCSRVRLQDPTARAAVHAPRHGHDNVILFDLWCRPARDAQLRMRGAGGLRLGRVRLDHGELNEKYSRLPLTISSRRIFPKITIEITVLF